MICDDIAEYIIMLQNNSAYQCLKRRRKCIKITEGKNDSKFGSHRKSITLSIRGYIIRYRRRKRRRNEIFN